jgi:Skp family chaperone for outer membrane proteins
MKTLLVTAALAAATLPTVASAQAIPGAVIAVVDLDRVTNECNACKSAAATLRSRATALQNRQRALAAPLETEGKAIRDAAAALKGKPADAALEARAKAWETKRSNAAQELERTQDQLQRDQQYISRQISAKLVPIYSQVMTRRGANMLVDVGTTLATTNALDVTNDMLAALNTALPSVQTNAPAATQQRQQPQGR